MDCVDHKQKQQQPKNPQKKLKKQQKTQTNKNPNQIHKQTKNYSPKINKTITIKNHTNVYEKKTHKAILLGK